MKNPLWTITGALATARRSATATLLASGKVLVTGGVGENNTILDSAEIYDPDRGIWSSTRSLQVARVEHTATLLSNGMVLVAGGRSNTTASIKLAELFDPATGEWSATGSLEDARRSHTATLLQTGLVLVAGGEEPEFGDRIASAELYDPATGTWRTTGSLTLNGGRTIHTATLLEDGTVLVVGGNTFGPFLAEGAELYDPKTGTWIATSPPGSVRYGHTATLLPSGKVLVAGGVRSNSIADELDSAELYDPVMRNFAAAGSLNIARAQHTATLLRSGKVLVAGGFKGVVEGGVSHVFTLRVAELYDIDKGEWSATVEMNDPRGDHSAALLSDGSVLVAGGARVHDLESVPLSGAELFSGAYD
jgi:Galactose oxidase, central domain